MKEKQQIIQDEYNKVHGIVPKTIIKSVKELISNEVEEKMENVKLSKKEKADMLIKIENEMKEAAKNMDFERAMELRDILFELRSE